MNEVPPNSCLGKANLSGTLTALWGSRRLEVLLEHRQIDSSRCTVCISGKTHVLQTPAVEGSFLQEPLFVLPDDLPPPPHFRDECFLFSVLTGSIRVTGD